MDNSKLISHGNNEQLQSPQLISGTQPEGRKQDNRFELSNIAQFGNMPHKEAGASMLREVTDHFKTTFSNVAKGDASPSEYLEVGALVAGTAALGTLAAGRLMQRNAPVVFGRSEFLASAANTAKESTFITLGPKSLGYESTIMTNERLGAVLPQLSKKGDELFLNFKGSPLTDEGLTHLIRAKDKLRVVDLTGTRVTEDGIRLLQKGLPNAEIIFGDTNGALSSANRVAANASLRSTSIPGDQAVRLSPFKPIDGAIDSRPNATLAEIERIIADSANAPVPKRMQTMTNEKLGALIPRLEATSSKKLRLNLEGSYVTDEGLKQLLPLQGRIKELNLAGTHITEDGQRFLRGNFPRTQLVLPSRYETAKNAAMKSASDAGKL